MAVYHAFVIVLLLGIFPRWLHYYLLICNIAISVVSIFCPLNNSGALYESGGFGLAKDEQKAHFYFMQAAEQGEVGAPFPSPRFCVVGEIVLLIV